MRILVACEFSGRVRTAFATKGHNAISCDLLPTEQPGNHLQCDVVTILGQQWDMLIAHPPCTYLANSGVRWLHNNPTRQESMRQAIAFFNLLLAQPIPHIAIENPIMHKYARVCLAKPYTQIIQPWQYGVPESKATCLWLKGLPRLTPTSITHERYPRVHMMPGNKDQAKNRSRTPLGIALAMASQWG